jgi:hypothetical protein
MLRDADFAPWEANLASFGNGSMEDPPNILLPAIIGLCTCQPGRASEGRPIESSDAASLD